MHRSRLPYTLVLLALAVALPLGIRAEGDAKSEAWARAMTPGAPHAGLADEAGEWRYVVTLWHEPGAAPMTLEGLATKTMIMGGRFLRADLTGEYMGHPFQGFGITGYDNVTREYETIWFDNMGTGIEYATGREDASGLQFRSTVHCPLTGEPIRSRSVSKVTDRDHHTHESYMARPEGGEFLHMRVDYTRFE